MAFVYFHMLYEVMTSWKVFIISHSHINKSLTLTENIHERAFWYSMWEIKVFFTLCWDVEAWTIILSASGEISQNLEFYVN